MTVRYAARYIRMSTDKQDLSPSVQKAAIDAYAAAHGMQVVATYEDEGRSGVQLKNRPALLRLLRDVTEVKKAFTAVLVYDVSRWGRFQDTDAAAYHEYHCRLHGVDVIYVAEMFGADGTSMSALLKSMKRAMAAEYSRELAYKCRAGQNFAIVRGFQIGPLPPLGFRRCSVSADGKDRVVLRHRQRKLAATDRIEWVLGPPEEVELVRRICRLYTQTRLSLNDLARLAKAEGWRNHWGCPMRAPSFAKLMRNEALIGNSVWGRGKHPANLVTSGPSRRNGCVPRLIDDETWVCIQRRTEAELDRGRTDERIVADLSSALSREPLLGTLDLRAQGLPSDKTMRKRLGSWNQCIARAGRDPDQFGDALRERTQRRLADIAAFGVALAERLREAGQLAVFDGHLNLLVLPACTVRPRLMWPTLGAIGRYWHANLDRVNKEAGFDLLVRMDDFSRPKDFFVVPPPDVRALIRPRLVESVSTELARHWCRTPAALIKRLSSLGGATRRTSRHA